MPSPSFAADAAVAGIAAALTTTAAIVIAGHREDVTPWAPLNSVSHILWGDEAATHTEPSATYTGIGTVLNAGAAVSWGLIHAGLARLLPSRRPAAALGLGAGTAALAYVVDYYVVPERLTPGFEKRLSGQAMAGIYAALAIGLAAGVLLSAAIDDRRQD